MLVDIMDMSDYITFNISLAKIFGLNASVYCSELITIYKKAVKKNKLVDDGFFKLDRKYVTDRTTLTVEQQLAVDHSWMLCGIMKKHPENPDIIKLDIDLIVSIITSEDTNKLSKLSKDFKVRSKDEEKQLKKNLVVKSLQDSIECKNYELLTALRGWVASIYSKPNTYLSKAMIKDFQKTLDDFAKGDLDLALRIVEIASTQCYKQCQWAIDLYLKDEKQRKAKQEYAQSRIRVTTQKVATNDTIKKDVKF